MKAFYIPAALLTLLLIAALWAGFRVDQYVTQWSNALEDTVDLLPNEQWDKIEADILAVRQDWDARKTFLHIILDHQDLDEADMFFAGAIAACKEQDSVEYRIHLHQLITRLSFLSETQQPNLKNIL